MLTDLFTGHTIRLSDLRAVSPTMVERRAASPYLCQRVLYAELHLEGNVTIRHNAFVQEQGSVPDARADAVWEQQVNQLKALLSDLTNQWANQLQRQLAEQS